MSAQAPHTIVVVSHTHWDREWYHPLGVMRQRLATLVDELLDVPDGLPFLLDGQAIVLDDYRRLRPERTGALRAALRDGLIEAGPWYVLADMLLPGGEALVRNLLEGMRTVREAGGAAPRVLYSPDAFGHAAAGPLLASGFGIDVAIAWRGLGGHARPVESTTRWTHRCGAQVLLYHLPPDGYETGASLPAARDAVAARWAGLRDVLLRDNPLRVALLTNGADHHARQSARAAAITALQGAAVPDLVCADTLAGFAARLVEAADGVPLREVQGELRDSSGWTWSLQGTFATRAHQKRTNAQVEQLLARDAEPWAALAWYGTGADFPALRTAWKTLLAAQPHDTLCGCSVDDVAAAADQRWTDARAQANAIRDDALRAVTGCNPAEQRDLQADWQPTLIVRNPSARARGGTVRLRLMDDITPDPVGPGSPARDTHSENAGSRDAPWNRHPPLQHVTSWYGFDRVESPLHYPHNAVVRHTEVLAWIAPVAGYSVLPVTTTDIVALALPVPDDMRVHGGGSALTGPTWQVRIHEGTARATHVPSGLVVEPLGWIESTTDAGDTYTPSLHGTAISAHWDAPRLVAEGPLRAAWTQAATIARARTAVAPATQRSAAVMVSTDAVNVRTTATLAMMAGSDWLEITLRGENTACDHRLRWVLKLPRGIETDREVADAAFGAVHRARSERDPHEWPAEMRLPTAPLHRWLLLRGAACSFGIVSDGLAEYELTSDGHLAITLVRAVGELSRRNLPERPGHAGWPAATPLAQSQGPFEARFAIVILPHEVNAACDYLNAAADDVLMPVAGDTWRGIGAPLSPFAGLTLYGEGLGFSAAKRSEDGQWLVLRCINRRDTTVQGSWQLPRSPSVVCLSRLDETPGDALPHDGHRVDFTAGPHDVVTLLVR